MSNLTPPQNSYGGGSGRFVLCQVVKGGRNDPEQSGRLRCRVIGYQDDKANIPDENLHWGRLLHPATNPMDGGIGGPVTGATEGTYFWGYFSDDGQNLHLAHSIGKAGEDNGSGKLDQSGRKSDINPHSRDKSKQGGDFRFDSSANNFVQKSSYEYARDESKNPFGETSFKDASFNVAQSWSLGKYSRDA